jgi:acetyl esterase/lipase
VLDRLDPELVEVAQRMPALDLCDIPAARLAIAEMASHTGPPGLDTAVAYADRQVPAAGGHPGVRVRIFRPVVADEVLPCLYWVPGAGHVLTMPDLDDAYCAPLAERHRCVVVAVDWRRSPEHPFPAALEDAYAGLSWLVSRAAELGVAPASRGRGGTELGGRVGGRPDPAGT